MKERIFESIKHHSHIYHHLFIDTEYLIYSHQLQKKMFYLISCFKEHYRHITGISTDLLSKLFFDKCYENSILTSEIGYYFNRTTRKYEKSTTNSKIKALEHLPDLFSGNSCILIQEPFFKGKVKCEFALSNYIITLGFIDDAKSKVKSLQLGYRFEKTKPKYEVELMLSRKKGTTLFDRVIINRNVDFSTLPEKLKELIDPKILD